MRAVEYLVNKLIEYGVSDVFGMPGGVVLDFLYELHDKKDKIKPHLSYHEQAAAFAASGYAQVNGTMGVVYVTRGPGLTNAITPVADAYSESTPLVLITGHSNASLEYFTRFPADQELDSNSIFEKITKYVARIDSVDIFKNEVDKALNKAIEGRKGPVLIDVLSSLWNKEISISTSDKNGSIGNVIDLEDINYINQQLSNAKRPVILAGDGIRQSNTMQYLSDFSSFNMIPILSSRCGEDSAANSEYYYGYIGSHGIRYSNAILSKADVILCLGNRLSFPVESKSYRFMREGVKIIQVDIDFQELNKVEGSKNICVDLADFMLELAKVKCNRKQPQDWIAVCDKLKNKLKDYDFNNVTKQLCDVISVLDKDNVIVNDVGNNEFWSSRAYVEKNKGQRIMFSKTFGAMGCAIPKAIGVYYRTQKPVICITGDQGFQINSQELNYISQNNVKICILVINNQASGMIRDREEIRGYTELVHTTKESGYDSINFSKIATAYNLKYYLVDSISFEFNKMDKFPCIVEIIEEEGKLIPSLPIGAKIYDMHPKISKDIVDFVEQV